MTSYKELFKLYDLIENGEISKIDRSLQNDPIGLNGLLPCKGIGVLHLAVGIEPTETSIKCTEILLKHGADPNLCSEDGMTPLHIASIWGRVENIKLLIGCGGDPSLQDLDGNSAFDYAAREQQWEVYDYLHNVVDEDEDSAKCAYTLDLERILVTTDDIVAEYEPVTDDKLKNITVCRKSDLVREWCDKTSLVMNRLYPTILTESNTIDNESWQNNSCNNTIYHNINDEESQKSILNETKTSFKSCFSKKLCENDLCISGIKQLEESVNDVNKDHCTCSVAQNNSELNKRFSVYENFSLPGSPTNITHVNYNSKTSLKKCQRHNTRITKTMIIDNSNSVMTSDNSNSCHSKDALAVAQNVTNERISNSSLSSDYSLTDAAPNFNTRRSSCSSGVSSSFSGGSIALASVEEEFRYKDKEEDVVLIEKRKLVSSVVLPVEEDTEKSSSPEKSVVSVASSLPASVEYDNCALRASLIRRGFKPGPINMTTRTLYLKKLQALRKNPLVVTNSQGKPFSIELQKSLRNDLWMKDFTPYLDLENKVRTDFANTNKKWREGTAKTSFTYLLLDPRMTNNLPARATKQTQHESWITFINSIFYVGKGKRSRPYSHLYQALTLWKRNFTTSNDKKVQHILDIWSEKVGVVCLHIFQNVIPAEAYTNEAAMIDVFGVANLKNLKGGNYYGVAACWPLKERRMFGLFLLYKAMLIFLSEGERQLRPDDID